jgi:uncharacterized LabA/DUF88 family protein
MRVAIFMDGKNWHSGWKDHTDGKRVDFRKLASWLVNRAGGDRFTGAYYYTGVETEDAETPDPLERFLGQLELVPGFFVYRFPRRLRSVTCSACGARNTFTQEKEVDTTMVADMLRLAAVDAFDALVLVSGDADHSPAIEGVRLLGKIAFVSTWGGMGLSARIRRAAFDHIDLLDGRAEFLSPDGAGAALDPGAEGYTPPYEEESTEAFVRELRRAEEQFQGGYVGLHYFVTRWRADGLTSDSFARRRILNQLEAEGRVEVYDTPTGDKAIRRAPAEGPPEPARVSELPAEDTPAAE